MAQVVSLDTHAVVKELQAAGFTEAQAEAVTRAVRNASNIDLSQLATKADLSELKADMLKWVIGLFGVQTVAVIVALVTVTRTLTR